MTFLTVLVKLGLNVYYALMKLLFPARDQVLMLSRQSDSTPLDFTLLEEALHSRRPDTKILILCKKIGPGLEGKFSYGLHLLRCTYQMARSKVVVIDGYSIPVCILRHRKSLQVVQIWHALGAVKKFGYQSVGRKEGRSVQLAKRMNMHRNYSYVLCASETTKNVYAKAFDMPKEQILTLGMPRVDYIKRDLGPVREELLAAYPRLNGAKTVVYIPTYRKSDKRGIENGVKRFGESRFN
ncbi:MAG: CDP-glycerol glycerophosphotransferase family protein, partial [Clostridiales bacterium]|nr:CDP-glycerol glycerophosphotransferase family protein [Clostridiales bacterium]